MRKVMVRYRVKPEEVARNEELVRAVYDELRERRPQGLRYATYKLEDGVTFVHVAHVDSAENPLLEIAAFQRFQEAIGERCDEPPAASALTEIGSFTSQE